MKIFEPQDVPIGAFKSFGRFGPKYKVESPIRKLDDGDVLVAITLLDSGEKVEHRLAQILDDPEAL